MRFGDRTAESVLKGFEGDLCLQTLAHRSVRECILCIASWCQHLYVSTIHLLSNCVLGTQASSLPNVRSSQLVGVLIELRVCATNVVKSSFSWYMPGSFSQYLINSSTR